MSRRNGTPRTETYDYDDLNRLEDVNYGDGQTQHYGFDAMGNRLELQENGAVTDTYAYNNANMMTRHNSTVDNYSYDPNGNTLSGDGRTMTWDGQNRMVSCTKSGKISEFTYGADGLRRSMLVKNGPSDPGVRTDFVIDGQNAAQEMRDTDNDNDLDVIATYLAGPRGVECRFYDDDNNASTPDKASWYFYDGLGSVLGEVNEAGAVTCTRTYDVYGAVRSSTGAGGKHMFVGNLGHTSEQDIGLIYMRARYYDPNIGRFVSEDPAKDGLNWYLYCENSPVGSVDANGMWQVPSIPCPWVVLGFMIYAGAVAMAHNLGFNPSPRADHLAYAMGYASMAWAAGVGTMALVTLAGSVETMGAGTGIAFAAGVSMGAVVTGVIVTMGMQQLVLAFANSELGL